MRRALIGTLLAIAAPARAAPDDLVARPIVLAPGELDAELVGEIDLAPGEVFHPTSLAPDAWFGLSDRLTVGVFHSDPSVDRIEPGASFCLITEGTGCDRLYHGGGIDARYEVLAGGLSVAPRARLWLRDVDPARPAMTLGAHVQWTHGRQAVVGDPYLQIGLANTGAGNRAELVLPVTWSIQPARRIAIDVRTGWNADVAVWRDGWHVPAYLGVRALATGELELGAAVGFQSVFGPQATSKQRAAFVTVAWRGRVGCAGPAP